MYTLDVYIIYHSRYTAPLFTTSWESKVINYRINYDINIFKFHLFGVTRFAPRLEQIFTVHPVESEIESKFKY